MNVTTTTRWRILMAALTFAAVATAGWALAGPMQPMWTKCPAQGCSDVCDPSGLPQYTCWNKHTGETWDVTTPACCCCNQDPRHLYYRGLR